MKERIEFITDSFTDYAGKVHHVVIAALSQNSARLNYFPHCLQYEFFQ